MIIVADNLRITLPVIGHAADRLDPRPHPAVGRRLAKTPVPRPSTSTAVRLSRHALKKK